MVGGMPEDKSDDIEDLGARLDAACASRPLDRAQRGMARRDTATHVLTVLLWLATAVILLATLLRIVEPLCRSGKLQAVDLVEFNPLFDIDGQGARAAARVAWQIAHWWR